MRVYTSRLLVNKKRESALGMHGINYTYPRHNFDGGLKLDIEE